MTAKEKPLLAFIGHSFHQKTRSHDFLVKILQKHYKVDIYWDETWANGKPIDIDYLAHQYRNFVFFQIIYGRKKLKPLTRHNVTIMPMYDAVYKHKPSYWKDLDSHKFFCFCHRNFQDISSVNPRTKYLQYYPPAQLKEDTGNKKPVIYFWQRVSEINWHVIRELLDPSQIGRVIINQSTDPGHEFVMPSAEDIERYNISFVSWFENPEDHFNLLKQIDIFVAPRPLEGIGFSFLNAMARGKVIIAANLPTANEYIDHETGYLYDLSDPKIIDLSEFRSKADRSYQRYIQNVERMDEFERKLINFVSSRTIFEKIFDFLRINHI